MKHNMKRFAAFFCMIACLVLMSGCAVKETAEPVDEMTASTLKQAGEGILSQFTSMSNEDLAVSLEQAAANQDTAVADGIASWMNVRDELGAFISVDSSATVIDQEDDGYYVRIKAQFEKRILNFSVGINKNVDAYTSFSFDPVYTIAEKMEQAGFNTIIGMGTVFIVLIFISIIISLFKYINAWEEKIKNKNKQDLKMPVENTASAQPVAETDLVSDLELVAVITAAIAASEKTSADGLVVRSIRRVSNSTWKKA